LSCLRNGLDLLTTSHFFPRKDMGQQSGKVRVAEQQFLATKESQAHEIVANLKPRALFSIKPPKIII
jgi:hypothetical protein